eukprot:CAMPEP_0203765140 /NCGR_PEP_ID=MMETSP0098-20131031/18250_1 /ASSEMBLY_ACC=CAM_ASM_000208 /TAXON_ID=96639 /ORGANISM=" , Strain NY0313808BC1" /LENGTH=97 /DNA_ID=CAMNT_0050661365 /DNA_START=278 /DNA_END=571 /DNA_ORIENTATION=+
MREITDLAGIPMSTGVGRAGTWVSRMLDSQINCLVCRPWTALVVFIQDEILIIVYLLAVFIQDELPLVPTDELLGWYAVGQQVSEEDMFIHREFWKI